MKQLQELKSLKEELINSSTIVSISLLKIKAFAKRNNYKELENLIEKEIDGYPVSEAEQIPEYRIIPARVKAHDSRSSRYIPVQFTPDLLEGRTRYNTKWVINGIGSIEAMFNQTENMNQQNFSSEWGTVEGLPAYMFISVGQMQSLLLSLKNSVVNHLETIEEKLYKKEKTLNYTLALVVILGSSAVLHIGFIKETLIFLALFLTTLALPFLIRTMNTNIFKSMVENVLANGIYDLIKYGLFAYGLISSIQKLL